MILVVMYFNFTKQNITLESTLYTCFLLSFAFFLLGRSFQFYCGPVLAYIVMYLRFTVLFSVGIPSLLIANLKQCGIRPSRLGVTLPYLLGILSSVVFVMVRDGSSRQIMFGQEYGNMLLSLFTDATYSDVVIIAAAALLIGPSVYLIFYHLRNQPKVNTLILLFSTLVLGCLYIVGETYHLYWLFFVASYFVVLSWYWLIYGDIQYLKIQATQLEKKVWALQHDGHTEQKTENKGEYDFVERGEQDGQPPSVKNRELVDKAIAFIKANFNKEIELADIANYTNVSDSYLIRVFKKVTGKTINQYVTSYRILQAQRLLKKLSVVETSQAVGFKTPSYFSTVFKKSTGLSPVQFQKQRG
ncbi:helix-turn-helix domain-containing protein [Paraglaciecola sp.]|uniref:helix-turn-helix domain-containing protein n=1 Tax=Paraglaciecola sp. TaxID=1920173 RepID=UPI003EF506D9